MIHLAREVVQYGLAMAVALGADIACLALLVEVAGVNYLWAAVLAFMVGGTVAYGLCVRFIFRYRRLRDRRVEALTFVSLGVAGLAVNMGVIAAAVSLAHVHYLIAKIMAAGLSFFVNYGLRRLLLFTPGSAQGRDPA